MITILIWWLGLFLVFAGLGLLVRRAFGLGLHSAETLLLSFWMGWALSIGLLQIWHFWFKVDSRALVLLAIIGVLGLIWNRHDLWSIVKQCWPARWLPTLMLLLIGLWLANRVIAPIEEYDTALYHVTSVKWATQYPIVPGLGNLHGRLAFNSSFFLYAAMLGVGSWTEKAHHLANGLLILVLLAQSLVSLAKLATPDAARRPYYLFHSLLLAPIIPAAFGKQWIHGLAPNNLSPDVAIFALGIVLSGQVLALLIRFDRTGATRASSYDLLYITVLASIGITVKLSFVFLAGAALFLVLVMWVVKQRNQMSHTMLAIGRPSDVHAPDPQPPTNKRAGGSRFSVLGSRFSVLGSLFLVGVCSLFLLIPWMLRGIMLSGYPVFPSTIAAFPVDWSIPRALVISEANVIRSFGRQRGLFWSEVLGNSNWVQPWFDNLPQFVLQPLELTLLALLIAGFCVRMDKRPAPKHTYVYWLFLLPPAAAIVGWFVTSPNPRFAGALFWILAAGATALTTEHVIRMYAIERVPAILLSYAIFAVIFLYVAPLRNPLWIAANAQDANGLYPIPVPAYEARTTDSGLSVNVPINSEHCWNVPLPCTPYFRPALRLRNLEDMRHGFMLDRQREFVDVFNSSVPDGFTVSPNLGVALPAGWHSYEQALNVRWMTTPGKILIYTEQDTTAILSLTPDTMNAGNTFGATGQLMVTVNSAAPSAVAVQTGITNQLLLPLHQGFNSVKLELAAGNFTPSQSIPGNTDERSLSIAFTSIELTTVDQQSASTREESTH